MFCDFNEFCAVFGQKNGGSMLPEKKNGKSQIGQFGHEGMEEQRAVLPQGVNRGKETLYIWKKAASG